MALGLLVAVVSAQTATPTAANLNEAAPSHFGDLIDTANCSGKSITFDFIVPLVTGRTGLDSAGRQYQTEYLGSRRGLRVLQ